MLKPVKVPNLKDLESAIERNLLIYDDWSIGKPSERLFDLMKRHGNVCAIYIDEVDWYGNTYYNGIHIFKVDMRPFLEHFNKNNGLLRTNMTNIVLGYDGEKFILGGY